MRPLTVQAQQAVSAVLSEGDVAVDATAGNGHDTLFLARAVGPAGRVFAFDTQEAALEATRDRLAREGMLDRVVLNRRCHSEMGEILSPGSATAVMFNLGYLPGADHGLTTIASSTLPALDQALAALAPGGVLSLLAYTGHPGGREEADAVHAWAARLSRNCFRVEWTVPESNRAPPEWLLVRRTG